MEFALMLRRLAAHPIIVAIGAVAALVVAVLSTFDVSLSPLSVTTPVARFGAAQGRFAIDTDRPTLAFGGSDTNDLIARAHTVASFIDSGTVKGAAARSLGVPSRAISVTGPLPDSPGNSAQPVAQQRANAILNEGSAYSVYVETSPQAPTVTLFVQANDGSSAVRATSAIVRSLSEYLQQLYDRNLAAERRRIADAVRQSQRQSSSPRAPSSLVRRNRLAAVVDGRTVVRSLGAPVGGDVLEESGRLIAIGIFFGVFVLWCILVILVSGLISGRRRT